MMNRPFTRKSFTLIEVLVTVTVCGVVFVVLLSGFGQNLRFTALSEDYTTAALLARTVITELETETELVPGKSEGNFGDAFDRFRYVVEVTEDEERPFYRADLRVFFTRSGQERDFEINTAILKQDSGTDQRDR